MSSKKPDFIAYHVAEKREGQEKAYWTRIGAAWAHEDGQGYNINLDLIPANGGRIVLRAQSEKPEGENTEAGE